ncbi:MAG: galactose-1-phosphate uridylyltransferase [Nitrospiraceae bacterium]|nr:galactose-1-phosphate uridylyltransferase [Nitrospiraceae bacterium]
MPELRKDPILGRWVIISVERGKRPKDFSPVIHKKKGGFCPFCPGNEYTTPDEIIAFRPEGGQPNGTGWTLRVMPNKFPALESGGKITKSGEGMFDKMAGVGVHEVIIENPDHFLSLSTMPEKSVEDMLWAYFMRLTELKNDPRIKYVLIFKNEGESAGASLEHSHSQLIGLPIVPRTVRDELQGSRNHYDLKERCIFCDIIYQELSEGKRVIGENENYVALAPFAPRSPFETWILPKNHVAAFGPHQKSFRGLAEILQRVLKQFDTLLESPPYNYIIHTAPFSEEQSEYFHWHIEIMPKLTKFAGFEWGSGFYVNPTPPEEAARFMRGIF